VFCSTFDQKVELIFDIYDFDCDGFITQVDVSTVMASMPVVNAGGLVGEGKFTQEGGGLENFEQRVETMEEMSKILSHCFQGNPRLNFAQFKKMNEEISSDTVLSVMSLFRERLPCSENFWRYKRNYDIHMKANPDAPQDHKDPVTRRIASPKMRHVRALSPYSQMKQDCESEQAQSGRSFLQNYAKGGGKFAAMAKAEGAKDYRETFQQKLERIKQLKKEQGKDVEVQNQKFDSSEEEEYKRPEPLNLDPSPGERGEMPLSQLKKNSHKDQFIQNSDQLSPTGR
jgi:hypothetical protein